MRNLFILFFISISIISCSNNETAKPVVVEPQQALGQSINSDSFNVSFNAVLASYYELKNAFIKEDVTIINNSSKNLSTHAAALKIDELKADSLIINTAKLYTQNLQDELSGLIKETDLENKRKSFQIVTNDVYDLIRTVKYDRAKVYLQHCPMAFKNKGADWLSNSSEIENPYLPKMMLDCGVIKDSVDFNK
jgi:hypothetical protein